MTEIATERYTNILPSDCVNMLNDEAAALLSENRLFVEVSPITDGMRVFGFPFAGVYSVIPIIDESDSSNVTTYTNIRDDEFGETDADTAKIVLKRLGHNPDEYHFWPVYLVELEAPNNGLTKVLSVDSKDAEKGKFAGFGYKAKSGAASSDYNEWAKSEAETLLSALKGVEAWLNDLIMYVALRDADDGMRISEFEVVKNSQALSWKLGKFAKNLASKYRESRDYADLKAERYINDHIMPHEYQSLISDETRKLLDEQGLIIKIHEKRGDQHAWQTLKFFAIKELFEKGHWATSRNPLFQTEVIDSNELGETAAQTAANLLARVEGDASTTTWWPVYGVQEKEGLSTTIVTDELDLPAGKHTLLGIAFGYNHNLKPVNESNGAEHDPDLMQRQQIESLSDEERTAELEKWKAAKHNALKLWLHGIERLVNNRLITINFYTRKYGDRSRDLMSLCDLSKQDDINLKIQQEIQAAIERPEKEKAAIKEYLRTAKK